MGIPWTTLTAVWTLLGDVLAVDPGVPAALGSGGLLLPGVGVAALAWLSIAAGQSGVLFLNRVAGLRVPLALLVGLLWLLVLRAAEGVVTWLVALLFTGQHLSPRVVVTVFLLATAPQVFSVLTFLPHIGLGIGRVLGGWSFLVVVWLLAGAYALSAWAALLVAVSGWLVMQLASRLLAAPVGWLTARAWTLASGRPTLITSRDILAGTPLVPVALEHRDPAR